MSEYTDLAKYYDFFYANKSYEQEADFLFELLGNRINVLDMGCGTGIHMHLLEKMGYRVDGVDLNKGMLEIAKKRAYGDLHQGDLLKYKTRKKYDGIISMFAVFNHLKDYNEFEKGILNCYKMLNEDGLLIIDLHNGRTNGFKENSFGLNKRKMVWTFNPEDFTEHTDIEYEINGDIYYDSHDFKIYEIDKIMKVLDAHKLSYDLYENYSESKATDDSKNIEVVVKKLTL